jgi:hypothetical protein
MSRKLKKLKSNPPLPFCLSKRCVVSLAKIAFGLFFLDGCKTRVSVAPSKIIGETQGIPVKATAENSEKSFSCAPIKVPSGAAAYVIGNTPVYAYHWTDDSTVLEPQGLQKWMLEKFEMAKSVSLDESPNALGEGLYLSATPLHSAGLGRILIAVPLKENCRMLKLQNTDWEKGTEDHAVLKSDSSLVLFNLDSAENKVLVRSLEGIHLDQAVALDTRNHEGVGLETIAPIALTKASDWKTGIQHFGASFSFFGTAFTKSKEVSLLKGVLEQVKNQSTNAASNLTIEGWLFALQAEISSGGVTREQSLDKVIAENRAQAKVCSKVETRLTYRGSKHRTCIVELFEFLASQLTPQLATDLENVSMDYAESQMILRALGYGAQLSSQASAPGSETKEQMKSSLSKFLGNWQAIPGKAAAAQSLLKASVFFAGGETEKDLDSF